MADWTKIWERRQRAKQYHNSGTKAAPDRHTNSAAFVKSVIKRRKKNKVAHESRRRNRA